jgi:hypothetical protein
MNCVCDELFVPFQPQKTSPLWAIANVEKATTNTSDKERGWFLSSADR